MGAYAGWKLLDRVGIVSRRYGWEESDIQERREYEHYIDCYTDILAGMLQERGVDPWKDYANNVTEDI